MNKNNASNNTQEIDYNILAEKLNESNADAIKAMLQEHVKQAYAKILNESDEDEDDEEYVEEVEDTETEPSEETVETSGETEEEDGTEPSAETEVTVATVEEPETEDGDETEDAEEDFEEFKTGEDEYDFRGAKDDDLVKMYKRLNDSDGITVMKDGDKIEIKDEEAGTEYLIDLGQGDDVIEDEDTNTEDMTNESTIFEIALNEYDSHMGYTDDYQKKDPVQGLNADEPSKNGKDIDAGVPKGVAKPWSKVKKNAAPFNKPAKANECGDPAIADNAPEMEESVQEKGATRRMHVKSHVPNTEGQDKNPSGQHVVSVAGEYKGNVSEDVKKKLNKIVKENQSLKAKLNDVTKMLQEAAVVNVNLGGIIKLITENSTTKDEKHDIVNRFTNAHTVNESKALYESISKELQKKPQTVVNINEEKGFVNADSKTINESKFYQDENLMDSLGLMHKICK